MSLPRRSLLSVVIAGASAGALVPRVAWAEDPAMTERSLGSPDAKVTVQEFFSLTCSHCAAFSRSTFPQVKAELIDTGKVRFVYNDFPLDQIALSAAAVARTLPAARYEPFVQALFANQDRWAFGRDIDPKAELWKTAALAGMSRATFDAAYDNAALKQWIVAQQNIAQTKYKIDSTPSFVINGRKTAGAVGFKEFADAVAAAT
jgi:protein-disulfide isomerase